MQNEKYGVVGRIREIMRSRDRNKYYLIIQDTFYKAALSQDTNIMNYILAFNGSENRRKNIVKYTFEECIDKGHSFVIKDLLKLYPEFSADFINDIIDSLIRKKEGNKLKELIELLPEDLRVNVLCNELMNKIPHHLDFGERIRQNPQQNEIAKKEKFKFILDCCSDDLKAQVLGRILSNISSLNVAVTTKREIPNINANDVIKACGEYNEELKYRMFNEALYRGAQINLEKSTLNSIIYHAQGMQSDLLTEVFRKALNNNDKEVSKRLLSLFHESNRNGILLRTCKDFFRIK